MFQLRRQAWVARGAPPEHIDLHFDTDKRLDGSIVQFARHPCPLHRPSPRTKLPENINRVECGRHLPQDVLCKTKLAFAATANVGVHRDKTATPVTTHLVANHEQRFSLGNGHLKMLKLRQIQSPSFLIEGGDIAPFSSAFTFTPQVKSVWITLHECGSSLPRGNLLHPSMRRLGKDHIPSEYSSAAVLCYHFVYLAAAKDAAHFRHHLVQDGGQASAGPRQRKQPVRQRDLCP